MGKQYDLLLWTQFEKLTCDMCGKPKRHGITIEGPTTDKNVCDDCVGEGMTEMLARRARL